VSPPALLVIRADASQRLGSGHVMRCLALAEQWTACGGEVHFACRSLKGHLMAELQARGYPTHTLPLRDAPDPWSAQELEADARSTRDLMKRLIGERPNHPVWLLVDHYHIDASWHAAVEQPGLRIAVLDDLADRPLKCDVLIDQNALTHLHHRYASLTPQHCRRLLGAAYTLLREDVRHAALARSVSTNHRDVLIFLGGADNDRHTEQIVSHLTHQSNEPLPAQVLCGSMNPRWRQLQTLCRDARIGFSRAQRGMSQVMGQARAAIVACGMLAVELQALEVPSLLIPLSDIQKAVALDFEKRGRAVVLEPLDLTDSGAFDKAWARTLAMEHRPSGQGIIPLDGALKVVNTLMEVQS